MWPSHPFFPLDGRHRRGEIALSSSGDPTCWWWWCYEWSQERCQLSTEELTLTCLAPLPLELQLTAIGCTRVVTGVRGCNRG